MDFHSRTTRALAGRRARSAGACAAALLVACWFGCWGQAIAQDLPPAAEAAQPERELETDRDAFTPATSTVGLFNTVVESSYSYIDNRKAPDTNSVPELLVRWGITERVELRLGWNYEAGGGGSVISSDEGSEGIDAGQFSHESRALYGIKAALSQQDGWTPRSCIILEGFTPTAGEEPATQFIATYALGWELPRRIRLESALRYGTGAEEIGSPNRWCASAVLRVPLDDRWNTHIEYFGVFSQGRLDDVSQAFISPGTHYLVTDNLELGLRLGWGVTTDAANFFCNLGAAWRF